MRKWVVIGVTIGLASASANALEIPITVEEPAGLARTAEPVSGGIPLPWGQFKERQPFALFDANGKEVACQTQPLVIDEKGFLRWVLLDFQADLKPNEKKAFILRTGASTVAPAKVVKVTRAGKGVAVDTGAASFSIDADKPFGLFSTASAGGKVVVSGGEVSYTDAFDGQRYVADKPSSVEVEYQGPMRATVAVKGRFVGDDKSKFKYVARITAWSGRSEVFVKYSLANSNADHYCWRAVKDSSIALRLGGVTGATFGAGKPVNVAGEAYLKQGLHASYAKSGKVVEAGDQVWVSAGVDGRKGVNDVAEGWVLVKGPSVQVTDILFTADPARQLAVSEKGLTLTGITERDEGVKDSRGRLRGVPHKAKVRMLPDCSHHSSRYLIDLAAAGDPTACSAQAARARNRLWCLAPPAWYFETEGLSVGKFGTQADELKANDAWNLTYTGTGPKVPGRSYGRFVRGEDNHFETEEDIVEVLLLMWLRTGSRPFFDNAQAWAEYNIDMQAWRTDGWRYRDGGVWWRTGPLGNRPQRGEDPVTGRRNSIPSSRGAKPPLNGDMASDQYFLVNAKSCYCHNWGEGLAAWYCVTGDRDALEALIDDVEQNIDFHRRARKGAPGKVTKFSRAFTRGSYVSHAARMLVPTDPFVVEASDWFAQVYFQRPVKEPRGIVSGMATVRMKGFGARAPLAKIVGPGGMAAMKEAGVTENPANGLLTDPKSGKTWCPIHGVNSWMFPPLSHAMECYWRITGNEDAQDFVIAYGQAAARVFYQRHGNHHKQILVDFPVRGIARDYVSWSTTPDNKWADGVRMSGYLARFHPDVCARAYSLSGEPFLKQRAYDYWFAGSHRGYNASKMKPLDKVGTWSNYYGPHSEEVTFNGRTFYIWSHPRKDGQAPKAVSDLTVTAGGDRATVSFTAPADQGGGKVARYQVKCADKPIVDYETFLAKFNAHEDETVTNWWLAANLAGEPEPGSGGKRESFTVTGVPAGAKYFAVRSFDDSANRSALGNVAAVR